MSFEPEGDKFEAWPYTDDQGTWWAWACGDQNHFGFPTLARALEDALPRVDGEVTDGSD